MLKIRNINKNIYLNKFIVQEDASSDREFYYDKLLNLGVNVSINDITDNEISEITANYNTIGFNLFFLKHILDTEIDEISKYIEEEFLTHITETKLAFGLIDEFGNLLPKYVNNPFEYRQPSGILEPTLRADQFIKTQGVSEFNPYATNLLNKKPRIGGYPVFYNTFTFPYWTKKNKWVNENLLYLNQSFFGFSFILLELYNSTDTLTQVKIATVPIFNNKRYCLNEKPLAYNDLMLRPSYNLNNGDEGFSIVLPKKMNLNEVYVKFSYWDALNNRQINLLPSFQNYNRITNLMLAKQSPSNSNTKKWIQNLNNFQNSSRYIKYLIDNNTMKYRMFEYNPVSDLYDIEKNNYDLYELFFDDFWTNTPVANKKPENYVVTKPENTSTINPFDFSISNINVTKFLNKIDIKPNLNLESPKLDNISSRFQIAIDQEFQYVYNSELYKYKMVKIKSEVNKIPLINNYSYGIGGNVLEFNVTNATENNIKIINLQIDDLSIYTDRNIYSTYTNILSKSDNTVSQNKIIVNESLSFVSLPEYNFNADDLLINMLIESQLIYKILYYQFILNKDDYQEIKVFQLADNDNTVLNLKNFFEMLGIQFTWKDLKASTNKRLNLLDQLFNKIKFLELNDTNTLFNITKDFLSKFQRTYYWSSHHTSDFIDNHESLGIQYFIPTTFIQKDLIAINDNIINKIINYNLYKKDSVRIQDATFAVLINNLNNEEFNPAYLSIIDKDLDSINVRDHLIDTIVTIKLDDGYLIKPNKTFIVSVDFVYGDKIKNFIYGDNVTARGKIKLTVDDDGDTKNIFIPMSFTFKIAI